MENSVRAKSVHQIQHMVRHAVIKDRIHLCMRYAPQVLSPMEWGLRSPEITHGDAATLTPLVSRVRRDFFGEEGSEHFIVTGKPLGYGWNGKRSFRVIGLSAQWWRL